MKYFNARGKTGTNFESVTTEELKQLAASGQITDQDEICQVGSDHWIPASKVKGLFESKPDYQEDYDKTFKEVPLETGANLQAMPESLPGSTPQISADRSKLDLPMKVRELIHDDEVIYYASRPSKSALIIKMIVYGLLFSIISAGLLLPIVLLVVYFSWKNTYYVITNGRTLVMQGIFNVATKIILNKNIQLISINTGIIDRWLGLNSIELATSAQGGGDSGILFFFPGMSKGCVTLRQVEITDVVKHYAQG